MSRIRGIDYLNEYEAEYENIELQYDYDKQNSTESMRVILIRKIIFLIQMVMIGTACIATTGAIIAERNGLRFSSQPFGTMDNSLLYVAWASSAASVITAIIGCFSMSYSSSTTLIIFIQIIANFAYIIIKQNIYT